MPLLSSFHLKLPRPQAIDYPIYVKKGLLSAGIERILWKLPHANRYIIITDDSVKKLFGDKLYKHLKAKNFPVELISFKPGEKFKNEATKTKLDHQILAKKCGRDSMILALGGGVVGDMAGFVAATYMRGIPYIHIPTSLLAMVDSSIGGKVGIDTPYGKNLLGAFWHPQAIIADMDCLTNLPQGQIINGLMEALKIFLTYDKGAFNHMQKNVGTLTKNAGKNPDLLKKIILRAMELKAGVIERDEHEANERMVVNWGHTIGHAIEFLSEYKLLHGYAVALGILVEAKISQLSGILSEKHYQIIEKTLADFGIKKSEIKKYSAEKILEKTLMDKKNHNGKVKYVLLKKIGKVKKSGGKFGHYVDEKIVKQALAYFKK